ncbi:unnamed protein product [Bursaphelenchus okinawaensis]|uniref:Glucosylceramidase n=1 Tax=Bursaphelenchus okinawaensis TaxID=465554 RepID=A0A811L8K5_9BILA|nr:unnamed protein product [Bursaphelenchus okinawaensis]CAG9121122.1 unnamed protein product [Bursaphelenchus okinawaensis]
MKIRSLVLLVHLVLLVKSAPPMGTEQDGKGCNKQYFDQDSFVCTCSVTSGCDSVEPVGTIKDDEAVVYTTSLDGDRLTRTVENFGIYKGHTNSSYLIELVSNTDWLQKIIGFGGAITDSVQVVYDIAARNRLNTLLLDQYYGPNSIEYSLGRIPIGSSDFSETEWSYLEEPEDYLLSKFSLAKDKKVPLVRAILQKNPEIKLFASAWSAPGWMKDTGRMRGGGKLQGGLNGIYYLTYAKYILKFFKAYAAQGINFWGMTVQNEPATGAVADYRWQTMYLSPAMQRDFVDKRLAPMLKSDNVTKDILIMAHDDQRSGILEAAKEIYSKKVEHEVDGLGVHWYSASEYEPLTDVHKIKPDKFILSTEACNADHDDEHLPLFGSWEYAQKYAHDIIQNLRNYVAGWTDWNIWLNEQGGPNWVGNFVDAPIIVDTYKGVFYKQPMYYIMGHFSKFIPPNSYRLKLNQNQENKELETVGFVTPGLKLVLVAHNWSKDKTFELLVKKSNSKSAVKISLGPKSIKTIIFNN